MTSAPAPFDIVIVGQAGRLQAEALLFAASLRASAPGFAGRLLVAEPQPGPCWSFDPRMTADFGAALRDLGAEIRPFESRHFGESYPHGNKIEALAALDPDAPFVFFDSDTLITGDIGALRFDFDRPAASMRREDSWPVPRPGWPGAQAVWAALYRRFGLDLASSLDPTRADTDWQRYLYFNAGWFYAADPRGFGRRFTDWALRIRDDPPPELAQQSLDPWLDQVTLPLVIHAYGGGRPGPELDGLDGDVTCHYRSFPLLYAREPDRVVDLLELIAAPNRIKRLLKTHAPIHRMVYRGKGRDLRATFDRSALPQPEREIRNRIRAAGLWMR